jgi:ADP-L-glycero-D-manno-heptose 6-epimerase
VRVVVTGAAGMVGSNLVHGLNAAGIDDIIAVDDLSDGSKYRNLLRARIAHYLDRSEFYHRLSHGDFGAVEAVLHQGACIDTMLHDGNAMLALNYRCTKDLLDVAQTRGVRLIYASSAAVYGASTRFDEQSANEAPLNVYGWSKLLTDQVVRRMLAGASHQVVGLRYFNVYGPREQHKAGMASVAFQHFVEFRDSRRVRLFGEHGGYGAGQHLRDFVAVDDVVAVNLWFLLHPQTSGIFNVGTGRAQPFNDVALAVVNSSQARTGLPLLTLDAAVAGGLIEYISFPPALIGKYQCHTQADLSALRAIGCDHVFAEVASGVTRYMAWLEAQAAA